MCWNLFPLLKKIPCLLRRVSYNIEMKVVCHVDISHDRDEIRLLNSPSCHVMFCFIILLIKIISSYRCTVKLSHVKLSFGPILPTGHFVERIIYQWISCAVAMSDCSLSVARNSHVGYFPEAKMFMLCIIYNMYLLTA